MRVVVSTYKRHDLAALAVQAVRKLARGVSSVVVLDGSGTMQACPGADEVRHATFTRWAGPFAAIRMFPGEPLACIDDDVILVREVDLESRYTAGISKPLNGQMVLIVRPGSAGHETLGNIRLRHRRDAEGEEWAAVAVAHQCELIDDVWLHVDRGSQGDNAKREAVVAALSGAGPGTQLKALLRKLGIASSPNCSCNKRAALMDLNGCDWCEAHIDQIDAWLAEEAKKRKLPYLSLVGKALIRLAIRRARKKGNG